jgi:hypothetical protein
VVQGSADVANECSQSASLIFMPLWDVFMSRPV